MKLLVFSPFYPPHIGGLESHSAEFNTHAIERGYTITVFTPRLPEGAPEMECPGEHLRIIRFPAWEPLHNYPVPRFWTQRFWQLWRQATAERPDIVISRTRFFFSSLLALLYARWRHLPLVHIEHGSGFVYFHGHIKTALGKFYDRTFGRLVLRGADRIIANSEASARFVTELADRTATIIYRGYETGAILAAQAPADLKERYAGKIIVAYLGRLIDGKGVPDLIVAISTLHRSDIVCFIVGDGPDRARLHALARELGIEDQIVFFGHQPLPEALALLKLCDVFVNPSYSEGLPSSVVEAALLEKAIVATAVGGTREIISGEGDGLLILPGRPDILAENLRLVLDDVRLRHTLGAAAARTVSARFSWHRALDQYDTLFSHLTKTD